MPPFRGVTHKTFAQKFGSTNALPSLSAVQKLAKRYADLAKQDPGRARQNS